MTQLPPGFTFPAPVAPGVIVARALSALEPVQRMAPDVWAERHRKLVDRGRPVPWSFERGPYLRRPLQACGSGAYDGVVIVGPAQSGKSETANNFFGWQAETDPGSVVWLQTDRDLAKDYSETKLAPLIEHSGSLADKLLRDTVLQKGFVGFDLWMAWPVKSQLQMRSARYTVADDADRIPSRVQDAGHWRPMLEARRNAFEGKSLHIEISSPEAGEGAGIAAQYQLGTQEQFHVPCPHCGEYFAPNFRDQARFDKDGTPEQAAASVVVVCPVNGCIIEPRHQADMRAGGVWAGPDQRVTPAGELVGEARPSSIASFWIDGLVAFTTWPTIAKRWLTAELALRDRQEELELRSFHNTTLGRNYSAQDQGRPRIEADDLEARRADHVMGEVPDGVRMLVASVDVQANRFACLVEGEGDNGRKWMVDRFDILHPDADGRQRLRPDTHPEHWQVLLWGLMQRTYPSAGESSLVWPIFNTAIDTGGRDGVAENAYRFWHMARAAGVRDESITLVKGATVISAPLHPAPTFVERNKRGKPNKRGAKLFVINVHRLKNILDARLRRPDPGPGYYALPADVPGEVLKELSAEQKNDAGMWEKRERRAANESWDLAVYADFAFKRHANGRPDCRWLPAWARPFELQDGAGDGPPQPPAPAAPANGVRRVLRRGRNFVTDW